MELLRYSTLPVSLRNRRECRRVSPPSVRRLIEAAQASDSKFKKLELIEAAERALSILEPPSYVPRVGKVTTEYQDLYEGIFRVRRDLHRDRRLNEALIAIRQARADGDLTKATEIKTQLVMDYPDLTGDARLKE